MAAEHGEALVYAILSIHSEAIGLKMDAILSVHDTGPAMLPRRLVPEVRREVEEKFAEARADIEPILMLAGIEELTLDGVTYKGRDKTGVS